MRPLTVACLAAAFALVAAKAEDPVTKKNWKTHPKIVEVRRLYEELQAQRAKQGVLKAQSTTFGCPGEPYGGGDRKVYRDAQGRVRILEDATGSEDSAMQLYHYYDTDGRLRFVLAKVGAVNGSQGEYRLYFDGAGAQRLYEDFRLTKGAGYTWEHPLPDAALVRDPKAALAAKPSCAG
jgi:hypothetical protein